MNKSSFTTASTFPIKVIANPNIVSDVVCHHIRPVHIQLNPTNRCNLNCSYCSCKNRDTGSIMNINDAKHLIDTFKRLGTEAITITGGGEPLYYPDLAELFSYIRKQEISIGLTTNGLLFHKIDKNILNMCTWCRISVSDEQYLSSLKIDNVLNDITDFAFSYVLNNKETNYTNLINCIDYANKHNFTHIRLVDDILGTENHTDRVRARLKELNIDDSLVIYQGRKNFSRGNKRCLISLLKPNIDPDGNFLPCCGVQYAKTETSFDFDKNMIMNSTKTIEEIFEEQIFFDGSQCDVCYYSEYNDLLNILWDTKKLQHKFFI